MTGGRTNRFSCSCQSKPPPFQDLGSGAASPLHSGCLPSPSTAPVSELNGPKRAHVRAAGGARCPPHLPTSRVGKRAEAAGPELLGATKTEARAGGLRDSRSAGRVREANVEHPLGPGSWKTLPGSRHSSALHSARKPHLKFGRGERHKETRKEKVTAAKHVL